ncbi:tyrosine-type recombinase/integrase [Aquibium sp. LZ166]|uniref:Tyrosine-type recombinase/integrase n=1 Tax=Aquibium pacificus TaxID=3153579 RepID=A0ABV3SJF7_9HYPH
MALKLREWKTSKGEERTAWVVDYYDQNKKRHLKTFAKKKDAMAFQAGTHLEVRDGVHIADRQATTIKEAAANWLASCHELEQSTRAQYRQHVEFHIVPFVGDEKLTDVSVPFVRKFLDRLRAGDSSLPLDDKRRAPRSSAMVRNVRVSLGAILSDAQERGDVMRNAVNLMTSRKARAKAKERHQRLLVVGKDIPTLAEVKAILAAAKGTARPFLMTAAMTGLRASELRGLRWSDVDLDRSELVVRQRADAYQEIGSPKSKSGRRTVQFMAVLVSTLREWQAECPKGDLDLVFPNGSGNIEWHANIIKRWLLPAQVAAGVTKRDGVDDEGKPRMVAKYPGLHALRHFYASWCINRPEDGGLGLPPKVVQSRMGHSSITVTFDTYGHLFPNTDIAGTMDAAAAALVA